jgi:hypothetical protein
VGMVAHLRVGVRMCGCVGVGMRVAL